MSQRYPFSPRFLSSRLVLIATMSSSMTTKISSGTKSTPKTLDLTVLPLRALLLLLQIIALLLVPLTIQIRTTKMPRLL